MATTGSMYGDGDAPVTKTLPTRVGYPAGRSSIMTASAEPVATASVRGRVLIIDDEAILAVAIARMLKRLHDVTVVFSGPEALAQIEAGHVYDVILCDLMMPGMSGMRVHELLTLAHPDLAQRMVFMTGGLTSADSAKFLDDVSKVRISKPFAIDTLRTIVARYLD